LKTSTKINMGLRGFFKKMWDATGGKVVKAVKTVVRETAHGVKFVAHTAGEMAVNISRVPVEVAKGAKELATGVGRGIAGAGKGFAQLTTMLPLLLIGGGILFIATKD
jgi:hypothetical protein